MSMILELLDPNAQAQWVVFYSLGEGADGGTYYDAHSIAHMRSPLTMLACDMNGEPLSFGPGAGPGAPVRLSNQDHEFFGSRQSL
jgi:methionine sulfoxide reductase catalytic subunit